MAAGQPPRATAARGGGGQIPPPAIEALVCVRTAPDTGPADFAAYLRTEPTVAQVWRVAADIDAVVRLTCRSLTELDAVVARMRHHGGAGHTVTYLVLPATTGQAATR